MPPRLVTSSATVRLDLPLHPAVLVRRYKRFLADVRTADGSMLTVHCPNSGSMRGLDAPGIRVVFSDSGDPSRKLRHTLEAVNVDDGDGPTWVGVNTARPNRIVEHAIRHGAVPGVPRDVPLRREVRYGTNSRIDLLAEPTDAPPIWIEVKNTTLAQRTDDDRVQALFPDAVTSRGAKHMRDLAARSEAGDQAMVAFLVNRGDCTAFGVAADIDPVYAEAFDAARAAGVQMVPLRVENHVAEAAVGVRLETRAPLVLPLCARAATVITGDK